MSETKPKESKSKAVEKMDPETKQYLKSLPDAGEKEEIHELPGWVRIALVKRALEDLSYNDAAKSFGKRSGGQLSKYARSPAALKWLESLQPFLDDPVEMAKAILSSSAAGVAVDRLVFLELAKASGDYKEADKIARDIQDRQGIVAKKHDTGPQTVVVNLGSSSLEIPLGDSNVEDADYEVEE